MKYSPHVIQLSQLKAPKVGRGRPYTVDFGIAKPLYKQLLSYLLTQTRTLGWTFTGSNKPFKPLAWGLVALYGAVGISLIPSGRIVYANPILQTQLQPLAMLTMPTVAPVQPLQRIYATLMPFGTYANDFDLGQCTWGVASRLPVTWTGNANEWAANAQAQGIEVSAIPKVGSIATTIGDSYLGHVSIVTALNDDGTFTVWEENYYGVGVTDERITTTAEFQSFIYI